MLVIKKEDDNNNDVPNPRKTKEEQHAYNTMLWVLKNFSDLSLDDQLIVFSKMLARRVIKSSFLSLRDKVLADYNNNIDQESITITDLKAGYHIGNGMLEIHIDSIETVKEQLADYQELYYKEKSKPNPNVDELVKMSLVIERLIHRLSILNNGTPIVYFFRLQTQKQKLQVQQIKEKYQQQVLILKSEYEKKMRALDDKTQVANNDSINKTNIPDKNNVTNPNIDELEHYAKLKDTSSRTVRVNVNRPNNKQSESGRVHADTSNSSTTGTTDEDRSSGIFGETEERRSKEAVF